MDYLQRNLPLKLNINMGYPQHTKDAVLKAIDDYKRLGYVPFPSLLKVEVWGCLETSQGKMIHMKNVFGGELATTDYYHRYKDLWKFDLTTMMWTELTPNNKSNKAGIGGSIPSARSGHSAMVWKHYMIIFGGFYEADSDYL